MKVLVLNNGSSSCKFALYEIQNPSLAHPELPLWSGSYEWDSSQLLSDCKESLQAYLEKMPIPLKSLDAVGHRIVHGGDHFQGPVVITSQVKEVIKQFLPLAPLHNSQSLDAIETVEMLLPGIVQVAAFDTTFHTTLSLAASTYAGPYSWKEMGIKRYGFHGISYEYCTARCSWLLGREKLKIVCCHLGNGASVAAIDNGRSIDTTMGFTPLEGLMMGSRCGSVDPSILLFLEQYHNQRPEDLLQLLNHSSGLLGISGKSGDMRDILRLVKEGNQRAKLSFEMYVHSIKRHIGAMVGVLNGFDVLVFTGGVGENASAVRHEVCKELGHLGIVLDNEKNENSDSDVVISSEDSKVHVAVITTQEDWCIACKLQQMRSYGTI